MSQIEIIVEWACLGVGLLFFKRLTPLSMRLIVGLLLVTVINETWVAPHVHFYPYYTKNTSYNIFSLLDMGTWLYFFYTLFKGWGRRVIVGLAVLVYGYSLLELCAAGGWTRFHTDSFRVYDLVIIGCACAYLFQIARMEYHRTWTDPYFWICSALILFHSIFFLNLTTMRESTYWLFREAGDIFHLLQGTANILYYLLISVAFVLCSNYKRTSGTVYLRP